MTRHKIGFFGGSFDPIHLGHLKLAKQLASVHHLDQIWFCPANVSPYKSEDLPVPIEHRIQMIKLAIEKESTFSLLDIESKRRGVSYTIDTLDLLLKEEEQSGKQSQIFLILSDETAASFYRWKNAGEIIEKVPLLVGSRFQTEPSFTDFEGSPKIVAALKNGWTPTERLPISSSEIRLRLKKGLNCQEFLPEKVLDYIFENHLYS